MVKTIIFPSSYFDRRKVDEDLEQELRQEMDPFQACRMDRIITLSSDHYTNA